MPSLRVALARRRRRKKFLKRYTWDPYDTMHDVNKTNDIFLGASDFSDFFTAGILRARTDAGKEVFHKEFTVITTADNLLKFIDGSHANIQVRKGDGLAVWQDNYIEYSSTNSSLEIKLYGDKDWVDTTYEDIVNKFEEVKNVIEWIYSSDGHSIDIPIRNEKAPVEEMYPFLNGETLSEYYDRFMTSSASILLLIGPPGTGKTTFIRGLLQHAEVSAIVTYDPTILSRDSIFANYLEGDRNVMVIEDADSFLGARTDGNDMMHKFLNVGDGLVSTTGKKLIFSTNLPSIKDVDPALIRPGRCFDIVHFDNLTQEQAVKLAKRVNVELEGVRDRWSVAEIFHKQTHATKAPARKFGFV